MGGLEPLGRTFCLVREEWPVPKWVTLGALIRPGLDTFGWEREKPGGDVTEAGAE